MEIVFVRHGATDWNLQGRCQGATDLDLNEAGLRQAELIAERLSKENVAAVYSSRLKRALRTGELIGRLHQLPVRIEDDLRELDHGELEGLTFEDIKVRFPDFIRRWRVTPAELQVPGGEKLIDVADRAWSGLHRIAERHRFGETVVAVSHNFPILAILCRIVGVPLNQYRTFHLDPCGITRIIRCNGNGWTVTEINGRDYAREFQAKALREKL